MRFDEDVTLAIKDEISTRELALRRDYLLLIGMSSGMDTYGGRARAWLKASF